jgi:UTP:GlnB (protein PII) uridylyltransferase
MQVRHVLQLERHWFKGTSEVLFMPVLRLPYIIEQPIHGTALGISVKAKWRTLPPLLHELKRMNLSIHKAKYWNEWTTMYIKHNQEIAMSGAKQTLEDILQGQLQVDEVPLYNNGLPPNTSISIYNISTFPFTILDFGCSDRTGLFCEILEFLSHYDIDVNGAYINTIGGIVSNMFYISRNKQKLDHAYIEYLSNTFEHEMKKLGSRQEPGF